MNVSSTSSVQRSTANLAVEENLVKRFSNLVTGSAIGAATGVMLRTLGAGLWGSGYVLTSFFTGILVHGPKRNAVKLAVPLVGTGMMVQITTKVFLSTILGSLGSFKWVEEVSGMAGYLPIAFLQGRMLFLSKVQGAYLGPAVASAMGLVNTVAMGEASEAETLSFICRGLFFSVAFDVWGYYLWHRLARVS